MFVKELTLNDFRNYERKSVTFTDGLNVVCGANAVGKTNLIEGVYICGVGRSPRTAKEKDLIRWGANGFGVKLSIAKRFKSCELEYRYNDKGEKRISVDGAGITRIAELMGVLNVVFFSPDELKMIKDAPGERRRFMDISLCQQNRVYFYTLSKYNRILQNRNKLIKEKPLSYLENVLPVWNEQLAEEGARLITARKEFLETVSPIADGIHRSIAGENENLTIAYETNTEGATEQELKAALLDNLNSKLNREKELGYTLTGPHRDDFSVKTKGVDLRSFGSQGQQRTASLVIKLAEVRYFEKETGEKPVLLLDDVLSELDESRRSNLLSATKGIQTILTCTEYTENEPANIIRLS